MRSVSRITGISINTVSKLLIDAGHMPAQPSTTKRFAAWPPKPSSAMKFGLLATPRIRTSSSPKPLRRALATFGWTALDAASKLIVSWHVGDRSHGIGRTMKGQGRRNCRAEAIRLAHSHGAGLSIAISVSTSMRGRTTAY
jgi:hypothetical protein